MGFLLKTSKHDTRAYISGMGAMEMGERVDMEVDVEVKRRMYCRRVSYLRMSKHHLTATRGARPRPVSSTPFFVFAADAHKSRRIACSLGDPLFWTLGPISARDALQVEFASRHFWKHWKSGLERVRIRYLDYMLQRRCEIRQNVLGVYL